jgi:hypothetical protein
LRDAVAWSAVVKALDLPPGDILVNDTVLLPAGLELRGVLGATRIINGTTNKPAVQMGDGVTLRFGGGVIDVQFASKSGVVGVDGQCGLRVRKCSKFRVERCLAFKFPAALYDGIKIEASQAFKYQNNDTEDCLNVGTTWIDCNDIYAKDNISDANAVGLLAIGTSGMQGDDFTCYGNNNAFFLPRQDGHPDNHFWFAKGFIGDTSVGQNWKVSGLRNSVLVDPWGSSQSSGAIPTAEGFVFSGNSVSDVTLVAPIAVNNNGSGIVVHDCAATPGGAGELGAPVNITIIAPTLGSSGDLIETDGNGNGGTGYGLDVDGASSVLVLGGAMLGNASGPYHAGDGSTVIIRDALGPDGRINAGDALAAIANLAAATNKLPYFTGPTTAALTDISSFARTLLDDLNAAAARTTLGLVPGTDVEAHDPTLTALAGVVTAADKLIYATAPDVFSTTDFSVFARTLVDDPTSTAARATLSVYSIAEVDTLVSSAVAGTDMKPSVRAATTPSDTAIAHTGLYTLDGVALVAGDRVLDKNNATQATRGVYVAAAGAWSRAADFDTWAEIPGAIVPVEQGTVNADTGWLATADAGGTLGTTAITFIQAFGNGLYTAGTALSLVNGVFAVSDPELLAMAGVTSAADKLFYFTGSGTGAVADFTAFARTLVDDPDAATMRTTLGLVPGTNVEAHDATLTALAGVTTAADKLIYATDADVFATTNFTAAGRSMVGAADAVAQTALLSEVVGDSGSGGAKGLVPAASAGAAAAGKFLKASGAFAVVNRRFLRRRILTVGSGTFTPTSDAATLDVTIIDGGGAGGSCVSASTNQVAAGRGGSSGGVTIKRNIAVSGPVSYTVGAGGTPGATGNNFGGNGGNSTFDTLTPGAAGSGGNGGDTSAAINSGYVNAAVPTGGDENYKGGLGDGALASTATNGIFVRSGNGGDTPLGYGSGGPFTNGSGAGGSGLGYGAGGSGASSYSTSAAAAGGAGLPGVIFVDEYS